MTPRNKPSSALVAIVAVLGFLIVLGGISVAAAGPARAPADSPTPILAGEPGPMAPIPGDIVAVARYNGQPDSAPARSSPAAQPAAYRFFFPWVGLDTTLYVQNPAGGAAVTVVLNLYDLDGVSNYSDFATIPANGSLAWDLAAFGSLPAGFEGSAVLESDGPIAAVASVQTASNSLLAYNGAIAGDTEVVLPSIMRQYYNWNTRIWVQNTDSAPADLIVEYYAYGGGLVYSHPDTIPPYASHVYRQEEMVELPANFNGLAHIATTGESVAVAVETRNSGSSQAAAYDGLALATANPVVLSPRQQKAVDGWSSATQITNLGAMDANVDAGWYLGDGSTTWTQSSSLAPMEAALYYLPGLPDIPNGFDGSLIVDSDQIVAALVNWTNLGVAGDGLTTNPAIGLSQLATSTYLARVAHSLTAGTSTEFSIQNPGMSATDVTIRFYNQSGAATVTLNDTVPSLGVHRYATGDVGALGDEWEGSVVIESTQAVAVEAVQLLIASEVSTCPVVSNPDDSGSGTLRDCLERAGTGDTITFDTAVFPSGSPVSITLATALPLIVTDSLTIDGGNAGVILDGSQVGATPEIVLLDDISLTLDGGPNLINNGDFSSGLDYWQASDEHPGATRTLNSSDYFSAPPSLEWGLVAHTRESSTNFTEWINAAEGSTIVLHLWYRYGRVAVNVDARFADDDDTFREQWLPWQADWTEATIVETVPPGATAISVSFTREHSEMRASGLASTASGVTIQGLQVVNFPGSGIWLLDGAQYALIGGDSTLGAASLGQGNLLSGNYANGIRIEGVGTMSNTVSGNWIGTDASGTSAFGNLEGGLFIIEGAANNRVGGQTAGERNVITYNHGDGVGIENWGTNENRIEGNWIGVDADGTREVVVSLAVYSPDYATDQTIFLGTDGQGVWKSTDGGAHWAEMNSGLTDLYITTMAVSPDYAVDGTLFAGTDSGVFKSADGGTSWVDVSPASGGDSIRSIALSPDYGSDQTVLLGNIGDAQAGGLWKSADGGATWQNVAPAGGSQQEVTRADTADRWEPGASPWLDEMQWQPGLWDDERVPASALQDGGLMAGSAVAFSPDYATDQTMFVGGYDSGYAGLLYKSVDGGGTWARIDSGLGGTTVNIISVSPDYGNDGTLFAIRNGFYSLPFRSTDGGVTWTELTNGLPDDHSWAHGLALSPGFAADGTLFIPYGGGHMGVRGLFRSNDRGDTWAQTDPGVQRQYGLGMVAVSPAFVTDGELLLAVDRNGLLRSTDRGDTWAYANGDLTDTGNDGNGVGIYDWASGNIVGGNTPGQRNLISNNGFDGVVLEDDGTSQNVISGNYIGTNADGSSGLGNRTNGVEFGEGPNRIGGHNPAPGGLCSGECNLISGNGADGITVNSGSDDNTISGNYIGMSADGTAPIGNGYYGINLYASYNLVGGENATPGGLCSGECNLISGNVYGLQIPGYGTISNTVTGNYIGTDVNGTTAIPSLGWDQSNYIQIGGPHNRLGGATPAERNVIAGTVYIAPPYMEPTDNQIVGNYLGVDATGTTCIANGHVGISVWGSDHVIGGDTPAEGNWICGYDGGGISVNATGNTIAHNKIYDTLEEGIWIGGAGNLVAHNEIYGNSTEGVRIEGETALTNTLTQNSIYDNDLLGIDLVNGGNAELPAPVLTALDMDTGTVSGTACPECTVEVFSDAGDEGQWYESTVTANGSGEWAFAKGSPFTGSHVTATATDAEGNTSEFSSVSDIAIVGAMPDGQVTVGQPTAVRAELFNDSNQPVDGVPVTCWIEDPTGATVYDQTVQSDEIPAGTWAWVELQSWTPLVQGQHILTCESSLPVDQEPANDLYTQSVTAVAGGRPDVWTRDNDEDTGDVPSKHPWWVSPDIWVRHQPDGGLVHQNPIALQENTVYVRMRNRGNSPASGVVQVFWDRSRIGWPCIVGEPNVGTIPFEDLAPGELRILSLPWTPEEPGEHGLHTVIEAEGDPANDSARCSPHLPRWDNNVSWHNVIVFAHPPAGARAAAVEETLVYLTNPYELPKSVDLTVWRGTFPVEGSVSILLGHSLMGRWLAHGSQGSQGIEIDEASAVVTVTSPISGTLAGLPLGAGEESQLTISTDAGAVGVYEMQFEEEIDGGAIGGLTYRWIELDTVPPEVVSTSPPHGAVDVALDAPLVITFTEPIGPLSFDLALDPDPGPTGWLATWNLAGTVVTVTHPTLSAGQTYNVDITAGDACANPVAASPWSFTTAATGKWYIYLPVVLRH